MIGYDNDEQELWIYDNIIKISLNDNNDGHNGDLDYIFKRGACDLYKPFPGSRHHPAHYHHHRSSSLS